MCDSYLVKKIDKPLTGEVTVPGSKSMTNRALLLAALSGGKTVLRGVLFSDDSRHFLGSLEALGFELDINEADKVVTIIGTGGTIPQKSAAIDVGSAGTAARFLTAMLALSDGEYIINCSKQMESRPMDELFRVLTDMGAKFEYLKQEGHLPARVKGNGGRCQSITMDISKSTQYLSAMLMVTPITESGIAIDITSEKKTGSYIRITMDMLRKFGVEVSFDGRTYTVPGRQEICIRDYYIEPDVSAACYFYAAAAITGGSITVKNVTGDLIQGDMKFLDVLQQMGCTLRELEEGINVKGPQILKGIDIDMNDFSDQALTLAAIAPFAQGDTYIRNIGHIRGQECDRMAAIVNELTRCGIKVTETGDDIHIIPGEVKAADIRTYDDHRVAMAFTLLGLKKEGIRILDPMCCKKTFENYYEVMDELIDMNKEEYWDIYDSNKQRTGRTMKRNDFRLADDEYHLTVLGVVARPDGRYLITKRAMNKSWAPGWWEVSGGACMAGEESEDAVRREVLEETGLDVRLAQGGYVFTYHRENPGKGDNYFVDIYKFIMDFDENDVTPQEEETDGFMLATAEEIKKFADEGIFLHYDSIKRVFEE